MIKIKTIGVWGFEGALRGMRNPYESHEKSDSHYMNYMGNDESDCLFYKKGWCDDCTDCYYCHYFGIGPNDMALCKKLIKAGSEHRKFLRMIHVQADVLAPRYWWQEARTYKYLRANPDDLEMNSSSTMHLITKRELTLEDFSHEDCIEDLDCIIPFINDAIYLYNKESDKVEKEKYFRCIKQLLPEGFNQMAMVDTNYECLLSIYHQRKSHRLSEWSGENGFCEWEMSLPYFKDFVEALK